MSAELIGITINHRTAPLEVREKFKLSAEDGDALRTLLRQMAQEHLLLSTCERLEIYAVAPRNSESALRAQIGRVIQGGLDPERGTRAAQQSVPNCAAPEMLENGGFSSHLRTVDTCALGRRAESVRQESPSGEFFRALSGAGAALHLLRVAAGLESRIIGEPHVLGQVRQAYLTGLEQKTLGPILAALGRAAIHAGKRVRHETTINPSARSIVTLTLEALRESLGELSQSKVLIVGSGRLAGDLAAMLAYRGAQLSFAGRSLERARSLALRHQAPAGALDALPRMLVDADAVVACSSATEFVLTAETIAAVRRAESGGNLVILDLSVPRNVDPAVGRCHHVTLRHLEEILAGEQFRHEGLAAGESIVAEEVERFEQWRRERRVAPRIAELSRQAQPAPHAEKQAARRLHRKIMGIKCEAAA